MPKTIYNGQEVETVSVIPTWEAVARIHAQCLEFGEDRSAKNGARDEIIKMGYLVDELQKDLKKAYADLEESEAHLQAILNQID